MTTSKTNAIAPSADVTPDLVAQKSGTYGLVAEMKRTLPTGESKWEQTIRQLRKYDDTLVGWWSSDGSLPMTDTTILVHYSRSRAFVTYIQEYIKTNPEALSDRTSVIEVIRSVERAHYFSFRLEHGKISDPDLAARLTNSVQIPIQKVLVSFPNIKYYDGEPPLPLLLADLWTDFLALRAADVAYDDNLKARAIDVDVLALANEMQKAYGSRALELDERSVEFPKIATIRTALEALVRVKLALRSGEGRYRVLYKKFRKQDDVLLKFGELLGTATNVAQVESPSPPQALLFPLPDDATAPPIATQATHNGEPNPKRRTRSKKL
jgi:hypothetical protein